MCNDALRIAIKEKPRNRFELIVLAHDRLREYGLHSHYTLSACEVAFSVYRNKRRGSDPRVKSAFFKLDNQSYQLNHLIVRVPTKPRRFIYLTLQGSDHHMSLIDDTTAMRGSITITGRTANISFSKDASEGDPQGNIGIDVNERNVTLSDTLGNTEAHDTSEVTEIRERYRAIRAKIGERTRQDRRVSRALYAKYGRREKNRTSQRIHQVSKAIVERAKNNKLTIVMENLKGIRKLYRRGNGQGTSYRGRMNSWMFRELQRQVEYKASWEGIKVTYVSPKGTSSKCPECGSPLVRLERRRLMCSSCNQIGDRDIIASRNIMMAAPVRAAQPPRGSCEVEPQRQEKVSNPPSKWVEVEAPRLELAKRQNLRISQPLTTT
jgi:putative transposase